MSGEPSHKKVSFCTTMMNRGNHLAETLPQNLANNPGEEVEFVILDYGDKYGVGYDEETKEGGVPLKQWLIEKFPAEISNGRIKYARTEQPHFRITHAKNMAHRLATGDILCNLDADNVAGKGFATWLKQKYEQEPHSVYFFSRPQRVFAILSGHARGMGGRIALDRESFERVSGYNETADPGWGGDDDNLLERLAGMGIPIKNIENQFMGQVIPHNNKERICNLDEAGKERSLIHKRENIPRAIRKTLAGVVPQRPQVTADGDFGCGEVVVLQHDGAERQMTLTPKPHSLWGMSQQSIAMRNYLDWRNPASDGRSI